MEQPGTALAGGDQVWAPVRDGRAAGAIAPVQFQVDRARCSVRLLDGSIALDAGYDTLVDLSLGGRQAVLAISSRQANGVLAAALPGASLFVGDPGLDVLFLEHVASPLFAALEAAGIKPVAIDAVRRMTEDGFGGRSALIVHLSGDGIDEVPCGALLADEWLRTELGKCLPPESLGLRAREGQVVVAVIAGLARMSRQDLPKLQPGGGLILERAPLAEGRLWLRIAPGRFLSLRVEGSTAIVESETPMKIPPPPPPPPGQNFGDRMGANAPGRMTAPFAGPGPVPPKAPPAMPVPQSAPDLVATDDVPVEITCEVARFELPIGELANLRAGAKFPIPARPNEFVTVLANGVPIATADIVEVGRELAVRILSVKR